MSLGAPESYVGAAVDIRVPLTPLWKMISHFGLPLEGGHWRELEAPYFVRGEKGCRDIVVSVGRTGVVRADQTRDGFEGGGKCQNLFLLL